ncbi:MAG: nitroreductase family protein [Firmicutes bacterium]|nr:nitroreductase family protein [Bacillota bacterium]
MDFIELEKVRYSVRRFSDRPVSPEQLAVLLEAARLAPTAKNQQDFFIYVIQSPEALAKAGDCTPCLYGAPLALLFCCDRAGAVSIPINSVDFPQLDAAIVMTHVMLAAASIGLGSCWVGYFDETKTRAAFGLPENRQPVGFLPLGYPDMPPGEAHYASKTLAELTRAL